MFLLMIAKNVCIGIEFLEGQEPNSIISTEHILGVVHIVMFSISCKQSFSVKVATYSAISL